jgi:hypothetical protein
MSQTSSGGAKPRAPQPGSSSLNIKAGGNFNAENSVIAGHTANVTHDNRVTNNNRKRTVRISIGGAIIVVLALIGYGVHETISPSSIVETPGQAGATGTLQQIQQAEESGDASSWCFLASSHNSQTCRAALGAGWMSNGSVANRGHVNEISISAPTGGGDTYVYSLDYRGHAYGGIEMQWNGQRWELLPGIYDVALVDGGVFAALLEAVQGQGSFFGITISPSSGT